MVQGGTMCGIAGFCDFTTDLRNEYEIYENIVSCMGKRLSHRGPDDFNTLIDEHVALAHARLAVIDVEGGRQPMTKLKAGNDINHKTARIIILKFNTNISSFKIAPIDQNNT